MPILFLSCPSKISLAPNLFSLLFILFFIGSCGKAIKPKVSIPENEVSRLQGAKNFRAPPQIKGQSSDYSPIAEPGRPISLGFGIETNNHQGIPNRCINGSTEIIPTQEGFFSLDTEFSRDEIIDSLGIKADGSYNFGLSNISARGQFSKSLTKNSATANYLVFAYNKDKSQVFIPLTRNDSSKDLSPAEFLANCGNAYVAAQDFGSMLLLKFSLHLSEKEKNSSWGGRIGGNYLSFAKLKIDIQKINKEKNTKGTLSVSALQIGGKPSELGKILKTNSDKGIIEHFTLCDVKKLDECMSGLRSVEDYISNVFPKQIDDQKLGGSALLNTYPFRYPKTIGTDSSPGLDPLVFKARKDLSQMYDDELEDLAQLGRNEKNNPKAENDKMIDDVQRNLSLIREALDFCFHNETYAKCLASLETMQAKVASTQYREISNKKAKEDAQKKQKESSKETKE